MAAGGDFDLERGGLLVVQLHDFRLVAGDGGFGLAGEPGIVQGHTDLPLDLLGQRIVEEGQRLLPALRVDMDDAVPVLAVGTAQVDDVAVQHFAVVL